MDGVARVWRCGGHDFTLDRTLVMGIVNVTPDSFADGGRFETAQDAVSWGTTLTAEGADIVDVGGESTRPPQVKVQATWPSSSLRAMMVCSSMEATTTLPPAITGWVSLAPNSALHTCLN